MDVQTTLRGFIEQNFLARIDKAQVSNDDSLLDSGLIDSTGIFELVGFVEQTFNIEIQDTDIVPENFETVNSLVGFIRSKQAR
jgi:acyl carrier protein